MNTIKVDRKDVLMVAHRGLSGLEPENSIPAFVAAGNRSYYGVETDVHVTQDGKFVVIHDETTTRVAGDTINVEQSSYDLVRKITLDNIGKVERDNELPVHNLKGRKDLIIPSLEEYVSICKKYEKKCVLELKNHFEREYIVKMIEEIKKLDYLENMIFISFDYENMVNLRQLLPDQELQFLIGKNTEDLIDRLNEYNLDLDIQYKSVTKELVDQVHANNHKINCWTCDSKEDAEALIAMDVDFITTNILE